ncbi:unnamed protein product, partial [Brachionus calyciflorus]
PIVNVNEEPSTFEVIDDAQAQKNCFSDIHDEHEELNEVSQTDEQTLKKDNELSIDIAFKIELSDPKQQRLTTMSRPFTNNLKQKVQKELNRQLKAGIIRKSRSLYEYLSMPMGIKTAPAWFQRVIEDALNDLIYSDFGEGKNEPNHEKTKENLSNIKQEPVENVKTHNSKSNTSDYATLAEIKNKIKTA